MSLKDKKLPGALRASQPVNQHSSRAAQIKPAASRPKVGVPAQGGGRPVAPPVYRLEMKGTAQPKTASAAQARVTPKAAPVYRPQPKPAAAQLKTSTRPLHTSAPKAAPARPNAPPVYRPQPTPACLQPKLAPGINKARPAASPRAALTPRPTAPHTVAPQRVLQAKPARTAAPAALPRVIQRMKDASSSDEDEPKTPLSPSTLELYDHAEEINKARTGSAETRNTQAIAQYPSGTNTLHTQRWYSQMEGTMHGHESLVLDEGVQVCDSKGDDNVHAEMLIISNWLKGETDKPKRIGVSKPVCGRCSAVLQYYKISHRTDNALTKNWNHPYNHANLGKPPGALALLPALVNKSIEYGWDGKKKGSVPAQPGGSIVIHTY